MAGDATGADRAEKAMTAVVVVGVAGVAGWVSYRHAFDVVRAHGEDEVTARAVPLTVDGLVFASSMVLLHCARYGVPVPKLARFMLGLGIAATLSANLLHGIGHGPVGAIVAAWPAVALTGSYELLMWVVRALGRVPAPDTPTAVSAAPSGSDVKADIPPSPVESDGWIPDVLPAPTDVGLRDGRYDGAFPAVAALDVDRPAMVTAPASDRSHLDAVREWLADDPAMSGAEIARRLDVSERTGRRLRAAATTSN